jgi:hypothetical protein
MKSVEHAAVGAVVSAVAVVFVPGVSLLGQAMLWSYGLLLSIFIDLDHFVIARVKVGDWHHLTDALGDLRVAFIDQELVFPDVSITVERLLTHLLIGGALVGTLVFVSVPLAVFTAVVLYAHIVCDTLRASGVA